MSKIRLYEPAFGGGGGNTYGETLSETINLGEAVTSYVDGVPDNIFPNAPSGAGYLVVTDWTPLYAPGINSGNPAVDGLYNELGENAIWGNLSSLVNDAGMPGGKALRATFPATFYGVTLDLPSAGGAPFYRDPMFKVSVTSGQVHVIAYYGAAISSGRAALGELSMAPSASVHSADFNQYLYPTFYTDRVEFDLARTGVGNVSVTGTTAVFADASSNSTYLTAGLRFSVWENSWTRHDFEIVSGSGDTWTVTPSASPTLTDKFWMHVKAAIGTGDIPIAVATAPQEPVIITGTPWNFSYPAYDKEFYLGQYMRLSSGFSHNGNDGTKSIYGYGYSHPSNGWNPAIISYFQRGPASPGGYTQMYPGYTNQMSGGSFFNIGTYGGDTPVDIGDGGVHLVETYLKFESYGNSDGEGWMWVDGVLIDYVSGVTFWTAGGNAGQFEQFKIRPIFGGGSATVPAEQYMDFGPIKVVLK